MPREYYVYPNGTSIAVAGNNEYATQIPMSVSDATDVYTAINGKAPSKNMLINSDFICNTSDAELNASGWTFSASSTTKPQLINAMGLQVLPPCTGVEIATPIWYPTWSITQNVPSIDFPITVSVEYAYNTLSPETLRVGSVTYQDNTQTSTARNIAELDSGVYLQIKLTNTGRMASRSVFLISAQLTYPLYIRRIKIEKNSFATPFNQAMNDLALLSVVKSSYVKKSGDTMTGDLKWEINGRQGIAWKEYGYGDKFEIRPYFSGSDDSNYLAIQTATGGAGTDPGTTDKFKFYPSGASNFSGTSTSLSYVALRNNAPEFVAKVSNVDASKGNNNISSGTYYPCWQVQDSNGRILARVEGVLNSSGTIGSYWYVRNYNTSGTMVGQKGISMTMDKSGNLAYGVADPAKFRSAISALGNDEFTSAGITFNSTYVSSGGATCYRTGRSVFVKIQGLTVKNVTGRVTIGTIPVGYRPVVETSTFGLVGGHFLLEPNGEFKSEGFTNATAYESSAYLWGGG